MLAISIAEEYFYFSSLVSQMRFETLLAHTLENEAVFFRGMMSKIRKHSAASGSKIKVKFVKSRRGAYRLTVGDLPEIDLDCASPICLVDKINEMVRMGKGGLAIFFPVEEGKEFEDIFDNRSLSVGTGADIRKFVDHYMSTQGVDKYKVVDFLERISSENFVFYAYLRRSIRKKFDIEGVRTQIDYDRTTDGFTVRFRAQTRSGSYKDSLKITAACPEGGQWAKCFWEAIIQAKEKPRDKALVSKYFPPDADFGVESLRRIAELLCSEVKH